jgi:catechol 2,3-dioxygenase-like lactoylglutathione lyase family enzyme
MSATEVHSPSRDASVGKVDMHLEVEIIPVSDVDRAKQFYQRLGWRLDNDVAPLDGLRIVQFTPPGLRGLGHVRPGTPDGCPWLGRGRADRLRHRSGP